MKHARRGMLEGVYEAAQAFAKSLEGPVNAMMDAFYGVDLRLSVHVARGQAYYSDRDELTSRRTLFMHPLDSLFQDYRGEPSAHLEEALDWIFERCAERLEEINDDARIMADTAAWKQQARMDLWMFNNGVTKEHLAAAKALHTHRKVTGETPPFTVDELARALQGRA